MSEENKAPTINWQKPNGNTMETNTLPATVEYCRSLGWVELDDKGKPKKSDK